MADPAIRTYRCEKDKHTVTTTDREMYECPGYFRGSPCGARLKQTGGTGLRRKKEDAAVSDHGNG